MKHFRKQRPSLKVRYPVLVVMAGLICTVATAGKPVSIADRVISATVQKSRDASPGIQLMREDGTGAVGVNREIYGWPRWSPDGTMLGGFYKDSRKFGIGLMVMMADGSNEYPIVTANEFNIWNLTRGGVVESDLPTLSWTGGPNYADWVANEAFVFVGASQYTGTSELQNRLFLVNATGEITAVTETSGVPGSSPM